MLIPVMMSLAGAAFVAAMGWRAGHHVGYTQARRDMRRGQ